MLRRLLALPIALLVAAVMIVVPAPPADAHDPIFLTDEQTTPDTGPYLPDGAISWAIYGTFPAAGETRGFEFDLRDGDDLFVGLLIPNLEPELSLSDAELPYVELTMPDGTVRTLEAEIREIFNEQFSNTSYVTLVEIKEPAVAGRHQILVHSMAPSRFVVAVGEREEFFTPAERTVDRPEDFLGIVAPLTAWYETPPGAEAPVERGEVEEVDVDVDAIEEELEELAELEAAEEPEEAEAETVAEPEAADEVVDEVAVSEMDDDADDGSGLAWVVPLAIVLAAVGAAGYWFTQRRSGTA